MSEIFAKSYHHGNLRNELLDTAETQLGTEGVEELSLRALARSVGVSQTAPYRHFSDKNELLAALATRGYRKLLSELETAGLRAGANPVDQLFAFAHCYVNYARARNDSSVCKAVSASNMVRQCRKQESKIGPPKRGKLK